MRGWAVGHLARPEEDASTIGYQPSKQEYVDHLVAHECYHLVRMAEAPSEERKLPGASFLNYEKAVDDCLGYPGPWAVAMARRPGAMEMLHQGLVIQVSSYPADIRIERALADDYPELEDAQERSVRAQIEEVYPLTDPMLQFISPPNAYAATLHMVTAFARAMGDLIDDPSLATPLEPYADSETVAQLMATVNHASSAGYAGDTEATDRWARMLGLEGWYQWVHWDQC